MTLDSRTYNKLIEWKSKTNVSTLSISLNDKKKYFILCTDKPNILGSRGNNYVYEFRITLTMLIHGTVGKSKCYLVMSF